MSGDHTTARRHPRPWTLDIGLWTRSRHGFARAELLALLGIAVIILSIVLPGCWAQQRRRQVDVVAADFAVLIHASDRFFNEYQAWPTVFMGAPRDIRYGSERANSELLEALRAVAGEGNPEHSVNPRRIDFLGRAAAEEGRAAPAEGESYFDPWGTPYQVVVDANADGHCTAPDSMYGLQPDQDLLVWSCGPDGESDTNDDILAWKRGEESGR